MIRSPVVLVNHDLLVLYSLIWRVKKHIIKTKIKTKIKEAMKWNNELQLIVVILLLIVILWIFSDNYTFGSETVKQVTDILSLAGLPQLNNKIDNDRGVEDRVEQVLLGLSDSGSKVLNEYLIVNGKKSKKLSNASFVVRESVNNNCYSVSGTEKDTYIIYLTIRYHFVSDDNQKEGSRFYSQGQLNKMMLHQVSHLIMNVRSDENSHDKTFKKVERRLAKIAINAGYPYSRKEIENCSIAD